MDYKVEAQISCDQNESLQRAFVGRAMNFRTQKDTPHYLAERLYRLKEESAPLIYLITTELNNTDCKCKCGQSLDKKVTNSNLG